MSFEAYRISVRMNLVNNVSSGLALISQHLRRTDGDVKALHKGLGLLGGVMAGVGVAGVAMVGKMLKPAEEYTSQLQKMNMAGMKQAEVADAVGAAWKLAGQNLTTTATGNLKALLDLRNVTGSLEEAKHFLPIMQRMQTVLAASKDGGVSGHAGDLAFSAMKALDIRGAINDPKRLDAQADLMTRVIVGTQGRVTPEQFQSVFNYARQAKFSMSDDFAYKILPTLMLENASKGGGGGGSRGVGPALAAIYRWSNQGYVNKKSLPLLQELGLLTGPALSTSTSGTTTAPLKYADLAASNPFEWSKKIIDQHVIPYMQRHKMANTEANVLSVINMMTRGNQLAGSILGEFYVKRQNFERDKKLMEGVMSPEEAYRNAMSKDPETARRALHAQWENFQTSLMMNVAPLVVPALMKLSKGLNVLGEVFRKYPDITKGLVLGFTGLAAAMAISGTIMAATIGFKTLGAALTLVRGGIGLGGTLLGLGRGIAGLATTLLTNPLVLQLMAVAAGSYMVYKGATALGADKVGSWLGGKLADWFQADPVAKMDQDSRYIAARSHGSQHGPAHVYMDGRKVGEIVTAHQARAASRPSAGTTAFDFTMMPPPSPMGYAR